MRQVRHRDRPNIGAGADALLSLFGVTAPTPEQEAGALLLVWGLVDLHAQTKDA